MKRAVFKTACYLLLSVSITGCGLTTKQMTSTQSFGNATENMGKFGEEEYLNIRNGIIQMNKELIAIDNKKTASDLIFDIPASPQATATRIAAAKALKSYGELLVELATEDRTENLQKSANSLVGNIELALNKSVSEEDKEAINKLIVSLGSYWVDKKKADAAKEIIPRYEIYIDKIADLLAEDFSLDEKSKGYIKGYEVTAKRLKIASMRLVNEGSKYSVLERDRAVQALTISEDAISHATEISKKGKAAIISLKKANAELSKIIKDDTYSANDIKEYVKRLQELVNAYQVLTN